MYIIVYYLARDEEKLIGRPKVYGEAQRRYSKLTSKYPDRRYAIRKVGE